MVIEQTRKDVQIRLRTISFNANTDDVKIESHLYGSFITKLTSSKTYVLSRLLFYFKKFRTRNYYSTLLKVIKKNLI